jgi:error-prone DNA polymerase
VAVLGQRGARDRVARQPAAQEPDLIERTLADYETTGLSTGWHLVALLRGRLPGDAITSAALAEHRHGDEVCVAGIVVARQRPATAKGIVFMLLEDETGTVNVVVKPDVYERHRAIARADPLLLVRGRLERRERNVNLVARSLERIEARPTEAPTEAELLEIHRLREAVPPGQHFGRGRR